MYFYLYNNNKLHLAVLSGNKELVKEILKNNFDCEKQFKNKIFKIPIPFINRKFTNVRPLELAVYIGDFEIIEILIKYGSNVNSFSPYLNRYEPELNTTTPYYNLLCINFYKHIYAAYIEEGHIYGEYHVSPENRKKISKLLIENGANIFLKFEGAPFSPIEYLEELKLSELKTYILEVNKSNREREKVQ